MYQRDSDKRWVGVVDLGWVNGKRVRKTVSAKTLKELRPKFAKLKREVEAGVLRDQTTVAEWMDHWLTEVATERNRPSTLRTYRTYINAWIVPHLGKRRLDRLRPDHLRGLYAAMKEAGRSDATRRQVHAILRRALTVAERDGRITMNPATKVDAPPVGKGSHGKLTLAEAKAVLSFMDHPDVWASRWIAALLAGLRQGEALGLMWERVDFDRGVILVEQAAQRIQRQGVQIVPLKSDASYRAVPMLEPVAQSLWRERQDTGFVWGGDKPLDPRRDWQNWTDLLKLAGVPHVPLHAARATTASLLSDAGVPAKIISEIIGHSQVTVTEKHYIHGDGAIQRTAMDKLNGLVGVVPLREL